MQQPSLKHVTDMSAPPSGSASRQATGTEPEAFLAEKVGLLYNNLAYSVLINSVGATIVAGGLWATGGGWLLGLWLAVMYAVNSARAWLRYRYAARSFDTDPIPWLNAFSAGAAATGACWGAVWLVLPRDVDVATEMLLAACLAGMLGGSMPYLGANLRVLRNFVLCLGIPSIAYLLGAGDRIHMTIGGMAVLFLIAILGGARLYHQALHRSLALRSVNLDLVDTLTATNEQLRTLTDELEQRVRERTTALQQELARHEQAQAALRSDEQMFHLISESVSDMIAVWDRHGQQLYGSRSLTRALDRGARDGGRLAIESIEPEDLAQLRTALRDTLRTSAGRRLELRLRGGAGSLRRVIDCAVEPVRDVTGEPDMVVIVARDVTQRRAEEAALRAAKERLALAIEATGQVLFDVDCLQHRVYLDGSWAVFLGRPAEECTADFADLLPLVPDEEREAIQDRYIATLKGEIDEYHVEHRVRVDSGEYRWIASRAKVVERNAAGRAIRMTGTNVDVTERRDSERNLRLAGLAFDNMAEGLAMLDEQGRIVSVNEAFTRITGYPAAEAVGRHSELWRRSQEPSGRSAGIMTELRQGGRWEGRVVDRRKDGTSYPVWLSATAIRESEDRIAHIVMVFSDVTRQERDAERMRYLAYHDGLTGVGNRALFFERCGDVIRRAERHERQLAMLFIDVDQFKAVNVTLGHHAVDLLLIELASRLRDELRGLDLLARLGGDEFAVLLDEIEAPSDAGAVAAKLLGAIERPVRILNHEVRVTASIGISCFPGDGANAETLVQQADAAMYLAKQEGRNRYRFFSREITAGVIQRLGLASGLKGALERDELQVFYQPSVDAQEGRILGLEALLRWQHPERGLLSPGEFIHVAEETGVIDSIGRWVLQSACRQLKTWQAEGVTGVTMKVNLSPLQFRQPSLMDDVHRALEETNVAPEALEFEITESAAMQDPDRSIRVLREMRDLGIKVALDDFGTGHSSLSHLSRFPIQCLKIDRSFVAGLPGDHKNVVIASSVASLCRNLGLDMVGEGVESAAQAAFLLEHGCTQMQGFLFSPACDAGATTTLLRRPTRPDWAVASSTLLQ